MIEGNDFLCFTKLTHVQRRSLQKSTVKCRPSFVYFQSPLSVSENLCWYIIYLVYIDYQQFHSIHSIHHYNSVHSMQIVSSDHTKGLQLY